VKTVTTPSGGPAETVEYLVDTSGGLSQVVLEGSSTTAVSAYYVRGDDLISVIRPQTGAPSVVRNYHADGLGSIRALTDEAGLVTDTWQFEAFGSVVSHTGSDPNAYLFAGEMLDPNVGWAYHRARWMDPSVGRFASSDSFAGISSDPLTLHKYLYAGANPALNVDPSGLFFSVGSVSLVNAIQGLLTRMAISALWGAVFGGIDAALRGDDILEGAFSAGLVSAVLGPLARVKFIGPALVAGGIGAGLWGVVDAIEQDNVALAAFRSSLVLVGVVALVRPPKSGGRLGNENTQAQNARIAAELESRGWTITGGGGRLKEEYLPPLTPGRKGANWVDITAVKDGKTLRINTVDTLTDGTTPSTREAAAAALIRQKRPGDHLVLVPKNEGWLW
jgi:RHS repeat-associated protein